MVRVQIDHAQFCVCLASVENPYPDWKQHHVDQGFAIRPGAVSFCTISDAAAIDLELVIRVEPCGEVSSAAARALQVPFEVPDGEETVNILTITTQEVLTLPAGLYILQVEQWMDGLDHMRGRLLFCPGQGEARILKADAELTRTTNLVLTADPV